MKPSQSPTLYQKILNKALEKGILDKSASILVLCAGPRDKAVFQELGFVNVTLSNLSKNLSEEEFKPYKAISLDAESINLPDSSFDFCVVHAGLHHCFSPHKALLEMLRIARKGVIACEPYDSLFTRLACQFGFSQTYEIESTLGKTDFRGGGLRYGGTPNFVYRFNERDVEKCVQTAFPYGKHEIISLRIHLVIWARFQKYKNPVIKYGAIIARPIVGLLGKFPVFCNRFGFIVVKPDLPKQAFPWLEKVGNEYILSDQWVARNMTSTQ